RREILRRAYRHPAAGHMRRANARKQIEWRIVHMHPHPHVTERPITEDVVLADQPEMLVLPAELLQKTALITHRRRPNAVSLGRAPGTKFAGAFSQRFAQSG